MAQHKRRNSRAGRPRPAPSTRSRTSEAFSSELIRRFFAAALAFRRTRPWELLGAEELIDLDAPTLGLTGAALSIINDGGLGGLQVHRTRDVFAPGNEDALGRGTITVAFYTRRQLPEMLREEVRGLPFAPATGPVPALIVGDEGGRSRPLTRDDYTATTAILEAVTRFVEEHGEHIEARTGEPTVDALEVAVDGQPVTVHLALRWRSAPILAIAPALAGVVGAGPRPSARSVHRLKVTLRGTRPPIWRRLEVPSTMTLAALHTVIQIAVGWEDDHLHGFHHKGRSIGPADLGLGRAFDFDEAATELWAVLPAAGELLRYTYDFGDDWIHDIEVERVYEAEEVRTAPRCLDGRRAGPPEDCGGPWGLEQLLTYGRDPEDTREFYDPTNFSVAQVNAALVRAFTTAADDGATVAEQA